ncbi:MAG: hypothetical protein HY540_01870 [Deltaproteobacteria bacterium]|nr:hypothetical protein [Deltaproteobacteria bacterium]
MGEIKLTAKLGSTNVQVSAREIPKKEIDKKADANMGNGQYDLYLCGDKKCYHAQVPQGTLSMAKLFSGFSDRKRKEKILFEDESGKTYVLVAMDDGTLIPQARAKEAEDMEKEFGM